MLPIAVTVRLNDTFPKHGWRCCNSVMKHACCLITLIQSLRCAHGWCLTAVQYNTDVFSNALHCSFSATCTGCGTDLIVGLFVGLLVVDGVVCGVVCVQRGLWSGLADIATATTTATNNNPSNTLNSVHCNRSEPVHERPETEKHTVDRKSQFMWTTAVASRPEVPIARHSRFVHHTVDAIGHQRCRKFTQRFGNPSEVLTTSSAHC